MTKGMLINRTQSGDDYRGLSIATDDEEPLSSEASLWIVSSPGEEMLATVLARCLSYWGRKAERGSLTALQESWKGEDVHVVSVSINAPDAQHASVDRWVWPCGLPWTPCTLQPMAMRVDAGPVFRRGYTPSFAQISELYGLHGAAQGAETLTQPELAFWCNILARSLLFFDSTAHTFYPAQGWIHHDLQNFATEYHRTICPTFSTDATAADSTVNRQLAATRLFEAYAAHERCAQKSVRAATGAWQHISRSLEPMAYPNSEKLSLAEPRNLPESTVEALLDSPALQPARWDGSTLSSVLFRGAGIQMLSPARDAVKRFASSAGNLGSCELSLFVPGSEAVGRGLYRYRSVHHDLVRLQSHRWKETESALEDHLLCGTGMTGQAAIFLCGKLQRLHAKYGAFGYKLMCLDGGVMFSQLKLLAHAFGFSLQLAPDLGRRLPAEALQLRREGAELVGTAILTAEQGMASEMRGMPAGSKPGLRSEGHPLFLSADALARELSDEVLQADAWCSEHPQNTRTEVHAQQPEAERWINQNRALISVQPVLQRRASQRNLSGDAISEEALCDLLLRAHWADQSEWTCATTVPLTFFVLYHASSQGRRRLLHFDAARGAMTERSRPRVKTQAPSLYADKSFQAEATVIWAVGDLAAATRERGERGHPELLWRAGAALNRIWLMGIGRNLSGCMSAGILARTAQRELGFDGWEELPLCTLLLGVR